MTKEKWLSSYVLSVIAVVVLAIVLIVQVYEFRKDFSYLQSLKKEEVNLEVVWGQLLLEQSALTQPSRLEQAAVKELNMHAPSQNELIIVKP
ncbi:cell division protein FtsL [Marinomonas balearica]|uniref:cell division protein FtsL n=1 Tax=Marinomonas balearica TaxID=491947 RepID=UPI00105FDEBC|nr:cell division protein FtsL [Marinomonas balearica]